MTRIVALVVLTAIAVGIALLLQRRRPDPPSAPSYRAPTQLDRNDFEDRSRRPLVALFASTTCDTCPQAWAVVEAVVRRYRGLVAVQRLDVQTDAEVHARYRIDGVPTTVVADPEGVVVQAFFGPLSTEQLDEALLTVVGPPDEGDQPPPGAGAGSSEPGG